MATMFSQRLWTYYAHGYDALLRLQPYRAMMQDLASVLRPSDGERCLDAGCGTGNLIASLNHGRHHHIVGVDFSAAMLRRAARKGLQGQLALGRLDLPLPFRDEAFDALACVNVLYALPYPAETLAEFRRVLKAGGRLALVNPKASVSPLRIFVEHLRSLRGWSARLAVFPTLPALAWVGLCNAYLLAGSRRRHWFFPSIEELASLLTSLRFEDLRLSETYARQAWLVSGTRR